MYEEYSTAFEWRISLLDWFTLPRNVRVNMVATVRARGLIEYYAAGGDNE